MDKKEEVVYNVADTITCKNIKPLPGNDIAPPLTLDADYVVEETLTCQCGSKHLDVGLKSAVSYVTCYECGEELPRGKEVHWCHPSRFEMKKPFKS